MRKYPTPWQYLVDIIAQGRLKAAYASNDRKVRAAHDVAYRGLTEDEVVFEALPARKDGKLAYSMTSKVRGFKLAEVPFVTGSLAKMVKQNANLMVAHEDLATSQITGFYFCEDADQLHLLVHPNSNIHEALKMTGYEFEPQHYNVQAYAERDVVLQADGVVTIKHPVVAGEIYISHVQPYVPPIENRGVVSGFIAEDEPAYQSSLQEAPVKFATEPYDPSAPYVAKEAQPESLPEIPALDKAPAVGEEAGIPGYVAPSFTELTEDAVAKTVAIQEAAAVVPVSIPEEAVVEETAEAVVEEAPVEEVKPVVQIQKSKRK